jgi:putative membrane protein
MKRFLFILTVGFLSAMATGCDPRKAADSHGLAEEKNDEAFDRKSEEDIADFLADAIEDKYAEIKLAELASIKSSHKEIIEFAQELANDHTNTLTELQALADKKGIAVPVEEGEETKGKINKLSEEKDPVFDKKWCDELIAKHKIGIRQFELMSDQSKDPQLTEIVNRSLIDLRAKLDKLHILEKNIN